MRAAPPHRRRTAGGRLARLLLGALACLAFWTLPGAASAQTARRHLLVLTHDDGGPGTARLVYTGDDAVRLTAVLTELGGVDPRDVRRLDRPRPREVLAALDAMGRAFAAHDPAQGPDWLTVYYSGHADEDALLLGADRLPLEELEAAVARTGAQVRLIVLDACASGALARSKGGHRSPGFLIRVDDAPGLHGQVILASSASDEASQESDRLGGGVFTHHLVTGLRGAADRTGDGVVTLEEAYGYAYHRTLFDTAGSLAGIQHPSYRYDLAGRGELALTRSGGESTSLFFPEGSQGTYLVFDRANQTFVGEVRLEGEPARLGLPPGRYLVQKRAEDHLLAAEVTLSRGASARLEEADMERRAMEDDYLKGVLAANRLRAAGPRDTLRVSAAVQGMFDAPVRQELIPPLPLLGVSWERRGWPAPTLALDVGLAWGARALVQEPAGVPTPVAFSEAQLCLGVVKLWPAGRVQLRAGAEITGIYLRRAFLPPLDQPFQSFVNVTPGILAGVDVPLGRRAGLWMQGRAHYLYYYAGEDLSLGYLELGTGIFWRI